MAHGNDPSMPSFVDERGALVAVEFDSVPFDVHRIFAVSGPANGATRGRHLVECNELIILTGGRVVVRVGQENGSASREVELTELGATVSVSSGDYLEYDLPDAGASIMVLADQAYRQPGKSA